MCIIVFDKRSAGPPISKDILKRCEQTNPHGMGIMWATGKRVKVWHTLTDFDGLWARYCTARQAGYPVALHFRVTTHGTTSLDNCHPFWVEEGKLAVMHNGTISMVLPFLREKDENRSDTRYFVEEVLQLMPYNFVYSSLYKDLLKEAYGQSRFLYLDAEGEEVIINKWQGFEHEGVWFSHTRSRDFIIKGELPQTKEVKACNTEAAKKPGKAKAVTREPYIGGDGEKRVVLVLDHYGMLRYHSCFVTYHERARAPGFSLFAGDAHPKLDELIPVPTRFLGDDGPGMYGKIAVLRGTSIVNMLAEVDVIFDEPSIDLTRTYTQVHTISRMDGTPSKTLSAYVYYVKEMDVAHTYIQIPDNNWWDWDNKFKSYDPRDWSERGTRPAPSTAIATTTSTSKGRGKGRQHNMPCPECKMTGIFIYSYKREGDTAEQDYYWCNTCSTERPLPPPTLSLDTTPNPLSPPSN